MERTMAREKCDPDLGQRVHGHLKGLGIETPMLPRPKNMIEGEYAAQYEVLRTSQQTIMTALGLDMSDDSLADTPNRVADMLLEETMFGLDYTNFPKATTNENKFHYDELVVVNGITVQSMCEHHFQPFIGKATIAYLPNKRILGLSKFNRIVDFFSRRPQVQERLTVQISAALRLILDTDDVAVVIRAEHFCVKLRGVHDACSDTVTSKLEGKFRTVDSLRAEFLSLAHGVK
jgi:GTP cyclohydrolase I